MKTYLETYNQQGELISTEEIDFDPVPRAKKLLEKSDVVAMRCFKAGTEFPNDWKDYVLSLRVIIGGASQDSFPEQPSYPEGT